MQSGKCERDADENCNSGNMQGNCKGADWMMSTSQSEQIDGGEERERVGRELWADIHADIATPPFLRGSSSGNCGLPSAKVTRKLPKLNEWKTKNLSLPRNSISSWRYRKSPKFVENCNYSFNVVQLLIGGYGRRYRKVTKFVEYCDYNLEIV